ncbi:TRAP transporter substrate-binding protein [Salipaludibacillus agaradhaerens]|uniref:TRAP transporter substrate-binding protein n=1 Tax=Salipaludibacillus agaradhaerens TaxID=76935 RepID=A0A9Q4G0P4_SALAG|nr:TRAP transporter substrate-binding protein [Salipaludibacillus agaradhaerens]MCR6098237.1 TRAP transporter substrate-binding protein [Salipaludibacillus agaradhaerens]MCR6116133.1 TRAP transporter substrate-binding protein [Salipaludibacillus agaradhaerens]
MKMNSLKKLVGVSSAVALILVLTACGNANGTNSNNSNSQNETNSGESIELVAATINPSDSLLAETLVAFTEEIENQSDGQITFTVHTGGTVGNASSLYQSVISGDIDMIYSDTGWFAEHNPVFDILSTNYLFEDQGHYETIVNSDGKLSYFEDLLIESPGLKNVMFAGGLERNIISTFPIETASDLEGRAMRSGGSSAEMEWWRNLGANPTTIDFNEVYSALQTGVAEGSQNSLDAMIEQRFGEVGEYVARTQHNLTLGFIVMNNDRYESLSDEHKEAIQQAADIIQPEYIAKAFEQADESMDVLIDEFGVTFTDPDREEFIEKSRLQMEEIAEEHDVLDIVEDIFN